MFRRLPHTLPPDPVFEPDLEKLGFFVNDGDQIRMIKNPDQKYQIQINKNERINYLYRQACNSEYLGHAPPSYSSDADHRRTVP